MTNMKKMIGLLLLTSIIVLSILVVYKNAVEKEMKSTLEMCRLRIEHVVASTFFNIDLLETIIIFGYEDLSQEELGIFTKPIINQLDIRNTSFLPNGILEYVYPLKGNEKALGDNIFLIPERYLEARIAMKTRKPIISGPYKLTQGGVGLICRKAIFISNESGEDEFWGFVAVVLDVSYIISYIELPSLEVYGYAYELSATVNDLGKKIIVSSDDFDTKAATYIEIELPNGKWEIGLVKKWNIFEILILLFIFLNGVFISMLIYKNLQRKERELVELNKCIYLDHLTGVFNRKKLDILSEQIKNIQESYTVFYMDINNFKYINDTHGHETGDHLLIEFTTRVNAEIRTSDIIIRVGGDEFVVILFNIAKEDEVEKIKNKLHDHLLQTSVINQIELNTAASIGYAIYPNDGEEFEELLALADSRMYENKRKIKNK